MRISTKRSRQKEDEEEEEACDLWDNDELTRQTDFPMNELSISVIRVSTHAADGDPQRLRSSQLPPHIFSSLLLQRSREEDSERISLV